MKPLSQRDPRWGSLLLGHGTGTIYSYGCTITCLAMLLKTTPDIVNEKLKTNGGFAGATKNLVVWSALSKAFPQIISAERIKGYDNNRVKEAIEKNGACLVEVDGTRIGAAQHWVLFIGNQQIIDPWNGDIKPSSYYPPIGCTIINIKAQNEPSEGLKGDMVEIEAKKFEELVTKATKYDEFVQKGYLNAQQVIDEKANLDKQVRDYAKQNEELYKKLASQSVPTVQTGDGYAEAEDLLGKMQPNGGRKIVKDDGSQEIIINYEMKG